MGAALEDRESRFGIDPFRGQELAVWQGTIIRATSPLTKHKLVVSADCDLLNDKGAGEFFCLDVIPPAAFVHSVVREAASSELSKVILDQTRKVAAIRSAPFGEIADDVLKDWLALGDPGRWAKDLPQYHSNDLALLSALKACHARILTSAGQAPPEAVADALPLIASPSEQLVQKCDLINKQLRKIVEARLVPSRADLYIIPSIPGVEGEPGHYVSFKTLHLMGREEVCQARADLVARPSLYLPHATCRPMLIQSLMQKLMLYFTRIGLTNIFKTEQEAVTKTVMENF